MPKKKDKKKRGLGDKGDSYPDPSPTFSEVLSFFLFHLSFCFLFFLSFFLLLFFLSASSLFFFFSLFLAKE